MPPAATENGAAANGEARHEKDDKNIAFQGKQPYGMLDDLVIPNIMDIDGTDEKLWVSHLP